MLLLVSIVIVVPASAWLPRARRTAIAAMAVITKTATRNAKFGCLNSRLISAGTTSFASRILLTVISRTFAGRAAGADSRWL